MENSLLRYASVIAVAALWVCPATAQESRSAATGRSNAVPEAITYSGVLKDAGGQIRSRVAGVTFLLYRDEQGGAPLWMETQNVVPDKTGHYGVQLGATSANGLPANVFQTGEARWLAVQIAGELEQSRVMLVAVPYAMKAADAETIGGLPPSAFARAAAISGAADGTAISPDSLSTVNPPAAVTGSGTADYVPLWTGASTVGNSILFQTGTGTTARIGVNTTTPGVTLDVKGSATIRGTLALPAPAAATATTGKNSQPLNLTASVFNSSTKTAVGQTFRWQAEPAANNTTTPSATLNLLFGEGASATVETGLGIGSNGQISFAIGQVFPGTGPGTITGVTGGAGLTGSGKSGNVTLALDTTKVPQLATANTFTGNQAVNGNLSATGIVSGSAFNLGSDPFAFGSYVTANVFLGTQGGSANVGYNKTAVGMSALALDNGAGDNTAIGALALSVNTTGRYNTAVGDGALDFNQTGWYLTCIGFDCGGTSTDLINSTAIGAFSTAGASNVLALGGTGQYAVSVGIGTSTPYDDYGLTINTAGSNGKITGGMVVNSTTGNMYLGMVNGVHKFRVDVSGVAYADGGYQSNGADFAESVAVHGARAAYEPGDVLEIDETADRRLALSHRAYSHLVAGIYSTKPGMLASPHHIDDPAVNTSEVPLAVIGIVPCKVTAANGAINRGDLLVTSSRRGYAMKGTDYRRMLGAVVGKALEPLPKGEGVIQVLVTLQ